MKSPPVCIDTQVCIWGIKAQAKPGHKDEPAKIARAQQLFAELSKDKITVCLPSIVLAELLVHEVGKPSLDKLREDLCKRFHVLVFNTMCAQRHAEVVAKNTTEREKELIRNLDPTLTKAKLKADYQIVSSMLGNGIKVLYTEDIGLAHIARQAGLTVNGLPGLQESIFDLSKVPAAAPEAPAATAEAKSEAASTDQKLPEPSKPPLSDAKAGTNAAKPETAAEAGAETATPKSEAKPTDSDKPATIVAPAAQAVPATAPKSESTESAKETATSKS